MIAEGLGLLAAGMGMVFAFLTLLVFIMVLSAKLFRRFPDLSAEERSKRPPRSGGTHQTNEDLGEIAAAVVAAMARTLVWGRKSRHGEKES
jgi:oxaloacetate decarboxylase gamma subunit